MIRHVKAVTRRATSLTHRRSQATSSSDVDTLSFRLGLDQAGMELEGRRFVKMLRQHYAKTLFAPDLSDFYLDEDFKPSFLVQ